MSRFFEYDPNQAYLLPPNVKDVLGGEHLCFFVHRAVEQFDLGHFEEAYGAEGRLAYPPAMMLKVWLYAFALRVSSTRRLERRVQEDLAFRYLAGGLAPDHKTLSEFLRRHRRAINDLFTQVVQMARRAGMGKLGHVAIDSTRVRANASRRSVVAVEPGQRQQWARDRRLVRAFQQKAAEQDGEEDGGMVLSADQQQRLAEQPVPVLPKKGRQQVSTTDPDSRFLRTAEGWTLGYTADLAVSDDHLIVGARVTQNATDNGSLVPMVDEVERRCGQRPEKVTGDSGFFSGAALHAMNSRGIDFYVPDNNLRHEMQTGERAHGIGQRTIRDPEHLRLRDKLRTPQGKRIYQRRQAVVEPVFGVLKEQRGMRKFQRRGLAAVTTEWMMAVIAYNLTRMAKH
ncbi:MAG TPA: IS1182 family transposase [Bryobacteraceae bacterium]|nr:IS1182 family transposase [Bryobacteraceae bacterium]